MSPVWHMLVKKRNKAFAVIRDNEVCELMQDNVVQAFDIFLGEFEINPNGCDASGCFHPTWSSCVG